MSPQPDRGVQSFCRNVVMITIEAAPWRPKQLGEGVQFRKGHVADQVRPVPAPALPYGPVNVNHAPHVNVAV